MYLSTHKVQVRYLSFIYILAFFGVRKIPCVFVESSTYRQLVKKFRNYVFFPKFGYRNYRYDPVYVCQKNLLIAQTIFLFDQKTNVRLLSPSKIAKKLPTKLFPPIVLYSFTFSQMGLIQMLFIAVLWIRIRMDPELLSGTRSGIIVPDPDPAKYERSYK